MVLVEAYEMDDIILDHKVIYINDTLCLGTISHSIKHDSFVDH